jgi:hypothetical protein
MKVSGPINIVRLASRSKVLYLFFDYHEELEEQTRCGTDQSVDITHFFAQFFKQFGKKNPNEVIDFFLEVSPDLIVGEGETIQSARKRMQNYINSLELWLAEHFIYQKHENQVFRSRTYPNVRFHYIDIRQYFEELDEDEVQRGDISKLCETSEESLRELIDTTDTYVNNKGNPSVQHSKNFESILQVRRNDSRRARQNSRTHFLTKLLTRYRHNNVKEKILKYVKTTLSPFLHSTYEFLKQKSPKIMKYEKILKSTTHSDRRRSAYGLDTHYVHFAKCRILGFIHRLSDSWVEVLVRLVDLYFVRRLVDKDYVRKAILYSGCYHSINVILILVKYFNFRVTHADFHSVPLDVLNQEIRDSPDDNPEFLSKYLWPETLWQCSSFERMPPEGLFSQKPLDS